MRETGFLLIVLLSIERSPLVCTWLTLEPAKLLPTLVTSTVVSSSSLQTHWPFMLNKTQEKFNKVYENQNGNNQNQNIHNSYNWHVLGLSLFSITGAFGNILVCLTIRRDPALQTKTNYYLFSLAIADLAVCLFVIPFSIIQDFSGI